MSKPISVEVYTTSHRILGRISPGSSGLFSYLNIPTTSYMEIEGAHLSRLHQPGRMVARHKTFWLVKQEVYIILLSSRGEIGPSSVVRGGFQRHVPHQVHIVLGAYELQGTVDTLGKFDFGLFMFEGDRLFMPMYDANISATLFPNVGAETPALLLNRRKVDGVATMPRESPTGSATRPPTGS